MKRLLSDGHCSKDSNTEIDTDAEPEGRAQDVDMRPGRRGGSRKPKSHADKIATR